MGKIINTLYIEVLYKKKFILNELMFVLGMYIFTLGISYSSSPGVNIIFWFIFVVSTSRICSYVYEIVKSDVITSILNSRTSLLKYALIYCLISYLFAFIYSVPLFIYYKEQVSKEIMLYIFTDLAIFTSCLGIIIFYLTIVYKRTGIALSIFSTYMLFNTAFVFENNKSVYPIFFSNSSKIAVYELFIFYGIFLLLVFITTRLLLRNIKSNGIFR